jgi:hypothetical protein
LVVVVAVALLFVEIESVVAELAVAVFEIVVPSVTEVLTRTTIENVAEDPAASVELEQVTVPLAPGVGAPQAQGAGITMDLKVVCAGNGSVNCGLLALAGPLLVKTIV